MIQQPSRGMPTQACCQRHHLRNRAALGPCSQSLAMQIADCSRLKPPQPQQQPQQELSPVVTGTCAVLASAGLLLVSAPAQAAVSKEVAASISCLQVEEAPSSTYSHCQQQQQLLQAPPLQQQQQQSFSAAVQQLNSAADLAKVGQDRGPHWLIHVLSIGVVNMLGLWAVLKLLAWGKDNSTPVSVIKLHMGLRVDEACKLQKQLHFIRQMMTVDHGMFFTMEETIQACCQPPRGAHLAYADVQVSRLGSKHEGYDLFKQYAAAEEQNAAVEEADHVVHGVKPPGPHHRTALERFMGAAETQDAEESQACVVVTLVMLARSHITLPDQAIRDHTTFRSTMKQLCGHLGAGQLLAVELLLTPDSEEDFLSEAALMEDYPFLIDLKTGKPLTTPLQKLHPAPGSSEAATGYAA